jgi:hypothetical protein
MRASAELPDRAIASDRIPSATDDGTLIDQTAGTIGKGAFEIEIILKNSKSDDGGAPTDTLASGGGLTPAGDAAKRGA